MSLVSFLQHPAPSFKRHPVSACQPDLDPETFQALAESIKRDGLHTPILTTREGEIVDGWHRQRALQDVLSPHVFQSLPCLRVLSDAECEPENLAQLVSGLLRGRRHLSKRELAENQVRIYRACGLSWGMPGRKPEQPPQQKKVPPKSDGNPAPKGLYDKSAENRQISDKPSITREKVAESTGVSPSTAGDAMAKVKQEERDKNADVPNVGEDRRKAEDAGKRAGKMSKYEQLQFDFRILKDQRDAMAAEVDAAREILSGRDPNFEQKIGRITGELASARDSLRREIKQRRYWEAMAKKLEDTILKYEQKGWEQSE